MTTMCRQILRSQDVPAKDRGDSNDDGQNSDDESVNTMLLKLRYRNRDLPLCGNCKHTCKKGCFSQQCECYRAQQFCEHGGRKGSQLSACIGRPDLHPRPEVVVLRSRATDVGDGLYCVDGETILKGTVIGRYAGKVVVEAQIE